jgi:SNF2 family DNA or RNA helicase
MIILMEIMELCCNLKEKVLIFSQSVQTLDCIEGFIRRAKVHNRPYKYFRLDGSTPSHERQRQITAFNSPNCQEDLFLLSTRAGGIGINLTSANRVVLFDACWLVSLQEKLIL